MFENELIEATSPLKTMGNSRNSAAIQLFGKKYNQNITLVEKPANSDPDNNQDLKFKAKDPRLATSPAIGVGPANQKLRDKKLNFYMNEPLSDLKMS